MTAARLATLDDLAPRFGLDPTDPLDGAHLDAAFRRQAPRLLDIGVGNGTATVDLATRRPDLDLVAVELHRPGIAFLLRAIETAGLTNVRVVDADALDLLATVDGGGLAEIRVLFPDPWPKARHHKRRLVDPAFVATATDRLAVGGRLHLATDWADYADAMRAAIATDDRLAPAVDVDDGPTTDADGTPVAGAPTRWRSGRPERPVTAYERRGLEVDRTIADLVATRTR